MDAKMQAALAERGVFFYENDDLPTLKRDAAAIILEFDEDASVRPFILIPDHTLDNKIPYNVTIMTAAYTLIWEDDFKAKLEERVRQMLDQQIPPDVKKVMVVIREGLEKVFGKDNIEIETFMEELEDGNITDD